MQTIIMVAGSACWSTYLTVITFFTDTRDPQRMNPTDPVEPLSDAVTFTL